MVSLILLDLAFYYLVGLFLLFFIAYNLKVVILWCRQRFKELSRKASIEVKGFSHWTFTP